MATFAVMSGNTVANVILCDTRDVAEQVTGALCIEYTDENPAIIGWILDESSGLFVDPAASSSEEAEPETSPDDQETP